MKTVDYLLEALKHHACLRASHRQGGRNDGFLTDQPVGTVKLAEDDIVRVRYDAKTMRWIANRPSRITYPKAKTLVKQYALCLVLVNASTN